ncbi:triculamin-like lasso peptide [Streptomyces lydicus]|uniref:triculamin-like lasso peptide n=1 Tax=Streptomyces lydicus TaxID=47763 RepID=UPI0013E31A93|nr:hypothetical protein [Streptomyces lydicus]
MSKKSKPGDGIRGKGVRGRFIAEVESSENAESIRAALADLAETLDRPTRK